MSRRGTGQATREDPALTERAPNRLKTSVRTLDDEVADPASDDGVLAMLGPNTRARAAPERRRRVRQGAFDWHGKEQPAVAGSRLRRLTCLTSDPGTESCGSTASRTGACASC